MKNKIFEWTIVIIVAIVLLIISSKVGFKQDMITNSNVHNQRTLR